MEYSNQQTFSCQHTRYQNSLEAPWGGGGFDIPETETATGTFHPRRSPVLAGVTPIDFQCNVVLSPGFVIADSKYVD